MFIPLFLLIFVQSGQATTRKIFNPVNKTHMEVHFKLPPTSSGEHFHPHCLHHHLWQSLHHHHRHQHGHSHGRQHQQASWTDSTAFTITLVRTPFVAVASLRLLTVVRNSKNQVVDSLKYHRFQAVNTFRFWQVSHRAPTKKAFLSNCTLGTRLSWRTASVWIMWRTCLAGGRSWKTSESSSL